ncbi:acyl carrier protein [Actinomadura nitritigenes]|jgi:act minimal PKS acyl carrier protein|uniref:acyl carrier protein n=1 Tax=Actinomadura TaxID=1988 RepID=UPI0016899CA2|nr:acyl carrier protein [Actinomadura sp. RB99]MBD2892429.1 Oxytetracycline polyketide synthase acyl carrier protein [Actinomadura sp. RB99]
MADQEFTLPDLRRVLVQAAGEVTGLDGDILDVGFEELGYDSLALLEASGRIEREHGIRLEESALVDALTPRALLAVVNATLPAAGAA